MPCQTAFISEDLPGGQLLGPTFDYTHRLLDPELAEDAEPATPEARSEAEEAMPRVSDILNRHALDMDADMIVMGAYGHSRFREAIFGGATRNLLEDAAVPVFMAR